MTEKVKKLYKKGTGDKEFVNNFYFHEGRKPSILWDNSDKVFFAAIYMGWLMAKGKYNEKDYE